MRGVTFVRLCQSEVEKAKKNHWKLSKVPLKGDIIQLAEELELPPVMIARSILAKKGLTKNEINRALSGQIQLEPKLQAMIQIANTSDPVFSPKGTDYSKWRGDEGERILALWLDQLNVKYERDLGKGIPDFLLKKPLELRGEKVDWIESKATFGDPRTRKSDEKQFKRFDGYGVGVVVYWFGIQGKSSRKLITYMDLLKLLPNSLRSQVESFLNYVPPEFEHLI
jgi:hypothetical protein